MSAYLVDRIHIDLLVRFGASPFEDMAAPLAWWVTSPDGGGALRQLGENPSYAGRVLWTENLRSVAARYPHHVSGDRPGPIGLTDDEIEQYVYEDPGYTLTPLEAIHACEFLKAQSCHTTDYRDREAYRVVHATREHAIRLLPGSRGPWGWTAENVAARRRPRLTRLLVESSYGA